MLVYFWTHFYRLVFLFYWRIFFFCGLFLPFFMISLFSFSCLSFRSFLSSPQPPGGDGRVDDKIVSGLGLAGMSEVFGAC